MSAHPASAGLRQMADELDRLAEAATVPEIVTLEIKLERDQFAAVCQGLDLVTDAIPASRRTEKYHMVQANRKIGGLQIRGWNWLSELCTKRTVTKEVDEWVCDAADLVLTEDEA